MKIKSIKVKFPNNIKTNSSGFQEIISKFNEVIHLTDRLIEIDFENVTFFDANFAAIIGVYLEKLEENGNIITFNFSPSSNKVKHTLQRNQFLTLRGYPFLHDNFNTSVPYKKFRSADGEGFQDYILTEFIGISDFPQMTEVLGKKMVESVFEIYVNAKTHGLCNYIHTCGQVFKNKIGKPLQFCIVDSGKNIKENVSNHVGKDIESTQAILWAMKLGNTTKINETGGLGLGLIFEFIKLNKGILQVVSYDGFYEFKGGSVSTKKLSSPFLGTIVNLTVNLADTNSYYLSDEK